MTAANYGSYDRHRPHHPALLDEEVLTIGQVSFDYADVACFQSTTTSERDWDGQLLCAAVYGMGSAIILLGIMIGSLDWKFMIAVVFLAAICFMSTCDAIATRSVVVHRIELTLENGSKLAFVDGDPRVTGLIARRLLMAGATQV